MGPVFWFLKLTLCCFLLNYFQFVRWFKNCLLGAIVFTGLVFSTYTIVVTLSCGPGRRSDAEAYLDALTQPRCIEPTKINAIVANITTTFNAVSNIFLLLLPIRLLPMLGLQRPHRRGLWAVHVAGVLLCICSIAGAVFRVKSWQSTDLTGAQIPHTATMYVENFLPFFNLN